MTSSLFFLKISQKLTVDDLKSEFSLWLTQNVHLTPKDFKFDLKFEIWPEMTPKFEIWDQKFKINF